MPCSLRRHALAASLTAAALAAILATAAFALHQAHEAGLQRQLALARLQQAERAAAEARQANQRAEQSLAEAQQQRSLADSRLDNLLRLSYSFIGETYHDIANLAGATPIRATLLARTLEHLERLEANSPGEPSLHHLLIEALANLSDTYGGSNANLGDRAKARELLHRRAGLIARLENASPSRRLLDLDNRLRLAALESTTNRDAYVRQVRALEPGFDHLVATSPPSRELYRNATAYCFHRARIAGGNKESLLYYRRVIDLATAEERRLGGDESCWRTIALAHKYSANLYPPKSPEPYQHALQAAAYDQKRVELHPANAQARMDLSFSRSTIATHLRSTGQVAEARDILIEVHRQRSILVEIDPRNQWYRNSLWHPLLYASIYSAQLDDQPALASGVRQLEALAAQSPPPPYAAIGLAYLKGELVRPADSAAACAFYLDALRLHQEAPEADQRRFGDPNTIRERLAACAPQNNGSPALSREAP